MIASTRQSPTSTAPNHHEPDHSPSTRHPQLPPLPLEHKPAPWTSLPTAAAYLQKNELAEWLRGAATAVEALAIWLCNAPSDSHNLCELLPPSLQKLRSLHKSPKLSNQSSRVFSNRTPARSLCCAVPYIFLTYVFCVMYFCVVPTVTSA